MTARSGAALVLAAAAAAGAVLRRRRRPAARVDLYYEDGSMISLENGSPDAALLLPLAEDALLAVRSR